MPACSPIGNECYQKLDLDFDCKVTCNGLFADVNIKSDIDQYVTTMNGLEVVGVKHNLKIVSLLKQLNVYKKKHWENIIFDGYLARTLKYSK